MHPLRAEPPADLEASVGRWARLLAEAALDLDGPELRRFLDRVLPHDADLRQEVENLLLADREAARFLAQPALGERPPCAVDPESLLERGFLGPYRLEGLLGRGGMGRVFLARRRAGEVRRVLSSSRGAGKACEERPVEGPVALKVAREGHLLGERLGQEGRILARLSHPAIASVLGAGTLEGLPYLAMEFVDGLPIDRYLAERSWREVVTLLAEVCEGVEYAHRNLVLHRDLKPANILVTTHGKPKIVDFGVAKLLEESGRVLGISTMTRLAGSPATPAYASPEQLLGRPLTTASDTYSLGVILYQLLSGKLPRDLDSLAPQDLELTFASTPRPPSEALESEEGPGGPARRGSRGMARDLDAVVLKAVRPEPEARYGTVAALKEDLVRCLEGLPVGARRWTPVYRASSFLRRHRRLAAGVTVVLGLGLALGVMESRQATRLALERDRAVAAHKRSEEVTHFITSLLNRTNPQARNQPATTVDELLVEGAAQLQGNDELDPEVREEILETLGETHLRRRQLGPAIELLGELLELRSRRLPRSSPEVARVRLMLAEVLLERSNPATAEKETRLALEAYRRASPPYDLGIAEALSLLTAISAQSLKVRQTEELGRQAVDRWRRLPGDHRNRVREISAELAKVLRFQGRFSEAIALQRKTLEALRAEGGAPPLLLADQCESLALALISAADDLEEAERLLSEAETLRRSILGETTATSLSLLRRGQLALARGDLESALTRLEKGLDLARATDDYQLVALVQMILGQVYRRAGDFETARSSLDEVESLMDNVFPRSYPYRLLPILERLKMNVAQGDATVFEQQLTLGRDICNSPEPFFKCAWLDVLEGRWLLARGEATLGFEGVRRGADALAAVLGEDHPEVLEARGPWPAASPQPEEAKAKGLPVSAQEGRSSSMAIPRPSASRL